MVDTLLIITIEEEGDSASQGDTINFEFPIKYLEDDAPMKNISPSTLPNFNGLSTKDPYAFPFEFHVLCKSYDYTMDA